MEIIAFAAVSALILLSSLSMVLARDMVRAALSLALAFIGVAALFILLEAEFLAAIQVLIYAGAVVVLMLFAVMLTKRRRAGE
jgi:NADH-quinone oxidoreductase subunit J